MALKKKQQTLFNPNNKRIVRFGLSRKKHLPCIWVGEITNFSLLRLDVFFKFRGMKFSRKQDGNIEVSKNGFTFTLDPKYATIVVTEFADWDTHYCPPFSLKNRTVIDVGAGCGETIMYYALKGCRNFIAIEPNPCYADLLMKNSERNCLTVKVHNDIFRKEHLEEQFDFMKCDCEGGESILLQQEKCKPVSLEVHGDELRKKFMKRGFKIVKDFGNGTCIMRNY